MATVSQTFRLLVNLSRSSDDRLFQKLRINTEHTLHYLLDPTTQYIWLYGITALQSPNNVVMAENINIFKNRLDKFWSSYDFVYLFRAQPLDTGSVK